ncbi:hypothetical protein [uncultured Chryseobacterium sp.]|uniref:hypothetical protein n=1 Tax=uncultured Chryseobacterium sp. TaxID=259322 RepID=UPI0025D2A5D2|nr:hypothetical protein [uncultured Chryseobacterium sp.]
MKRTKQMLNEKDIKKTFLVIAHRSISNKLLYKSIQRRFKSLPGLFILIINPEELFSYLKFVNNG